MGSQFFSECNVHKEIIESILSMELARTIISTEDNEVLLSVYNFGLIEKVKNPEEPATQVEKENICNQRDVLVCEKTNADIAILQAQLKCSMEDSKSLRASMGSLKLDNERLLLCNEKEKESNTRKDTIIKDIYEKLQILGKSETSYKAQCEILNAQNKRLEDDLEDTSTKLAYARMEITKYETSASFYEAANETKCKELESKNQELIELNTNVKLLVDKNNESLIKTNALQNEVVELQKKITEINSKHVTCTNELEEAKDRIKTLEAEARGNRKKYEEELMDMKFAWDTERKKYEEDNSMLTHEVDELKIAYASKDE